MSDIALVVGLGNPGPAYERTRHNAGYWFVNELNRQFQLDFQLQPRFRGQVAEARIGGRRVRLLRPGTYMNESGQPVAAIVRYYGIEPQSVLVIHDDLDLEPGVVRLKEGGGHGGHNGLRDLMAHLGSTEFVRLRLGIGHPGQADDVADYVLRAPSMTDRAAILDAVARAITLIGTIVRGDHASVMNELHRFPVTED